MMAPLDSPQLRWTTKKEGQKEKRWEERKNKKLKKRREKIKGRNVKPQRKRTQKTLNNSVHVSWQTTTTQRTKRQME